MGKSICSWSSLHQQSNRQLNSETMAAASADGVKTLSAALQRSLCKYVGPLTSKAFGCVVYGLCLWQWPVVVLPLCKLHSHLLQTSCKQRESVAGADVGVGLAFVGEVSTGKSRPIGFLDAR